LKDEDGDASDWIELRNPNAFGLDVSGYFLTDDPADLKKWALPEPAFQRMDSSLFLPRQGPPRSPDRAAHEL